MAVVKVRRGIVEESHSNTRTTPSRPPLANQHPQGENCKSNQAPIRQRDRGGEKRRGKERKGKERKGKERKIRQKEKLKEIPEVRGTESHHTIQ